MDRLRETGGLESITLPFGSGVTMVTGRPDTLDIINRPFERDLQELAGATSA
jgi:hypothetical protein